jgi:cation transport regulator ChaB
MIPVSISRLLPDEGKAFYASVYNKSYSERGDEALAHEVAWTLTKARMRSENGTLVACSEDFIPHTVFQFALEPAEEILIKNHDNGDVELNAVLATTEPRKTDGASFTEEALVEMARQINEEGSTFPDVDHETLSRLQAKYQFDPEGLVAAVKREKGVFRSIKAAVKNGKLWIQALLDRRYHNYKDRFTHLSVEALAKKNGRTLTSPRYLGLTFTKTPQLSGALIV